MAVTHIDIPESLREQINERSAQQGYSGPDEYVRALIQKDLYDAKRQRLVDLLQEGLASPTRELTPTVWQEIKERARTVAHDPH